MKRHTYEVIGSGVDYTGWFKIWLRRDDGKEVKVNRKRVAELRRDGRVTTASDAFGDCRYAPATCDDDELPHGSATASYFNFEDDLHKE